MSQKLRAISQLLKKVLYQPKIIFGVYFLVAIFSAVVKYLNGETSYNNYMVFKNVFTNTRLGQTIYGLYPEVHFDSNYYGVFFSILIAPFAILPDWLGIILWNLANVSVLVFAFSKLPFSQKNKSLVAWLCLQEYITAAVSLQFNVALTGLLILSAVYIYERKETQSAIAILIGFFVKIYGIVGFSNFFFIRNKTKFIVSFIVGGMIFFLLPMMISSVEFGIQSYYDWYAALADKNTANQVLGNRQDYSIMGIVRRVVGNADISNFYFLIPGGVLFALPYFRVKQFGSLAFQMMILCSTLLFVVLFSSGSESPTYIIAVAGVMIWFVMKQKPSALDIALLLFVIVLTCFGFSDIFPRYLKDEYIVKYSLKALPCALVWFKVIYELMTNDYTSDETTNLVDNYKK